MEKPSPDMFARAAARADRRDSGAPDPESSDTTAATPASPAEPAARRAIKTDRTKRAARTRPVSSTDPSTPGPTPPDQTPGGDMSDAPPTDSPVTLEDQAADWAKQYKDGGMTDYNSVIVALRLAMRGHPEVDKVLATSGMFEAVTFVDDIASKAARSAGFVPASPAVTPTATTVADASAPSQELTDLVAAAVTDNRADGVRDDVLPKYVAKDLKDDKAWTDATQEQRDQALSEALASGGSVPPADNSGSELDELVKPVVKDGQKLQKQDEDLYDYADLQLASNPVWAGATVTQRLTAIRAATSDKPKSSSRAQMAASRLQDAKAKKPTLLAVVITLIGGSIFYAIVKKIWDLLLEALASVWIIPTPSAAIADLLEFVQWLILIIGLVWGFFAVRKALSLGLKKAKKLLLKPLALLAVAALFASFLGMGKVAEGTAPTRSVSSRQPVELNAVLLERCKEVDPEGTFSDFGSAESCALTVQNNAARPGTSAEDRARLIDQAKSIFKQACKAKPSDPGSDEGRKEIADCIDREMATF